MDKKLYDVLDLGANCATIIEAVPYSEIEYLLNKFGVAYSNVHIIENGRGFGFGRSS